MAQAANRDRGVLQLDGILQRVTLGRRDGTGIHDVEAACERTSCRWTVLREIAGVTDYPRANPEFASKLIPHELVGNNHGRGPAEDVGFHPSRHIAENSVDPLPRVVVANVDVVGNSCSPARMCRGREVQEISGEDNYRLTTLVTRNSRDRG